MTKRETKRPRSGGAGRELTAPLATCRDPLRTGFEDAWVGLEPTFTDARTARRWGELAEDEDGEDRYFEDPKTLARLGAVAKRLVADYRRARKKGAEACIFAEAELSSGKDQWGVKRKEIVFRWDDRDVEDFEVRLGLDPEVFEYSIKPAPARWFHDERFVAFLERFVWGAPLAEGLVVSLAHGGGQFHLSAKTFLGGSVLADDVAHRLDHPELATWVLDYPNPDDRGFRATPRRARAFERVLEQYWSGAFHPRATGTPTVETAYFDRFEAAPRPPEGLVDRARGPVGDAREVFQTNFAFGRAVRLRAQSVEPGYWQAVHPKEDGYRPDQVMRYSEGNLNRLQIDGELHVKSGKPLDPERARDLDAPLDPSMLNDEASWEMRAQMSKSSARDQVEAVLLELHHARWLATHPGVRLRGPLEQDRLLVDAERTLERRAPRELDRLRRKARAANLEASQGRLRSDRVEPEDLFWAAWRALPAGERAAVAREAILGFVERVENAASVDPRPGRGADPLEPHRHRVHPHLWAALEAAPGALDADRTLAREWKAWKAREREHRARRPMWSPTGERAPWSTPARDAGRTPR